MKFIFREVAVARFYNPFSLFQHRKQNNNDEMDLIAKIGAVFFTLSGNFTNAPPQHVGIFDYLTLGIPLLIQSAYFTAKAYSKPGPLELDEILFTHRLATAATVILWIPKTALSAVRYTFAFAGMLAMSPLVLIQHAAAYALAPSDNTNETQSVENKTILVDQPVEETLNIPDPTFPNPANLYRHIPLPDPSEQSADQKHKDTTPGVHH